MDGPRRNDPLRLALGPLSDLAARFQDAIRRDVARLVGRLHADPRWIGSTGGRPYVHLRINGWCDTCGGTGAPGVEHEDRTIPTRGALVPDLSPVERYAIDLVVNGAESHREDDLNEDGAISEEKHPDAVKLAGDIIKAIEANPRAILDLTALHTGRAR